jgi:hypothetical protein
MWGWPGWVRPCLAPVILDQPPVRWQGPSPLAPGQRPLGARHGLDRGRGEATGGR